MELVVGQFNDSYEPVMDGVANVTKNYAYWLEKKGCKTYVITPNVPGYQDTSFPEVKRYFSVPLPYRRPYRLGIPQVDYSFKHDVKNIPFDIVHCHSPFSSGQLALKIAKKRGIPAVATFHSKFYDDFKDAVKLDSLAKFLTTIIVDFYNKVDSVWTVNQSTADTLKEYGYKGNIEIVYNGADFPIYNEDKELIKKANDYLKVGEKELVFLFVGQHIWQKNLKMLMEALRILKIKEIKYKMFFVGEGIAKKNLEKMVDDYNLNECVKFLGLITDRSLLQLCFLRADLFLFPSLYDTSGIVVREAAAVKTPSLVIANSNAAEGIEDNVNGFVSLNNEEAFAQRIIEIINDREKLKIVGERAQKTIYRSWEDIVEEVKLRYIELIKSKNKKFI
ncbi:MAG: glycosyltransferase family 4 protein [Clostridiales bacterium]|uniref:glycosyltransferase n=1 Tax=Clostridium sp. N3C TaxID=1776758 RepID=UPI00092E1627|nr:glycosyltransferase [Clostridium sp. N3C]NLZ47919.1 glycosyltransferase family 4 protein [Clostridiales bacterium]SCN26391.1 putative glycosyltransferase EpsD [Clostridium sp. N3C]